MAFDRDYSPSPSSEIEDAAPTLEAGCNHIKRDWCLNCYSWRQPLYCVKTGHQDPVEKCIKCGEYFDPEDKQ